MAVHMVEIHPDMRGLTRFARDQGLLHPGADEDFGYLVHAWLRAAFGTSAPGPWRLLLDGRRPTRILAYSALDADDLGQHMRAFADPTVAAVCEPDGIRSKEMPSMRPGRRVGFEVLCCPVVREGATGTERDAFLHGLPGDRAAAGAVGREDAYCSWLRDRMEQFEGLSLGQVGVKGFRLVRLLRRAAADGSHRRAAAVLVRPQVLVEGTLTVLDPRVLTSLFMRGVGRHRAFGFGMVLLRPPEP
jgi:CRISPR system Cascade subunit CasE